MFVVFFNSKTINFHNSGIVGNVLSIGLQYTLSFKSSDFSLKCLFTITPQVMYESIRNFLIPETGRNYNSLLKLAVEQKRKSAVGHVLFELVKVSVGVEIYP